MFKRIKNHILTLLNSIGKKTDKATTEHDKKAFKRAEKAVSKIKYWIEYYFSVSLVTLTVCVSKGNKKIGRTLNVSLPPIITCANCSGCMKFCYDIKAVLQYVNVAKARAKNYVILMRDRDKYFQDIINVMKKRKTNKFLRWHVSGDIIDIDYFDRMVKIARMFPDFTMWTYTKAYHIVNKWCELYGKENIPSNLSIMFSEWKGMKMVNPFGFPEFRVVMKEDKKPENVKWCNGNCENCIKTHSHCVKGETVYCNEH